MAQLTVLPVKVMKGQILRVLVSNSPRVSSVGKAPHSAVFGPIWASWECLQSI